MSLVPLRAQELHRVVDARGCDPGTFTLSPEDPAVFHGMDLQPQSTACARGEPFDDSCYYSWSWDMTRCTDMLPYSVQGLRVVGYFTQISSLAASKGIQVGCQYSLHFDTCSNQTNGCKYKLVVFSADGPVYQETGFYNWTRSSRYDPNDGMGGANKQATVEFEPAVPLLPQQRTYGSTWIARERFDGSFQSQLGFATFTIMDPLRPDSPCVAGGASNPNPTEWGTSYYTSMK